jgi:hypothetical protein
MNTSNIEPELNSLLTKLTAEIETDQREIKIRQKRIKANEILLDAVRGSLGVSNPDSKANSYGAKAETVKLAIQQITNPRFTQDDVEAEIQRANPEMQINRERVRAILWGMKQKEDVIKQVRKGDNRQPAEFEKVAGATNGIKLPVRKTFPPPPRSAVQS